VHFRARAYSGGRMALHRLEDRPGVHAGYFLHQGPGLLGIHLPLGGGRLPGVDWRAVAGEHQLRRAGLTRPPTQAEAREESRRQRVLTLGSRTQEITNWQHYEALPSQSFVSTCGACQGSTVRSYDSWLAGGLRKTIYGCQSCGRIFRSAY